MSRTHKMLAFAFLAVCLTVGVFADQAIEGVVKDNTGGVIPGVTVILTSTDTGQTRETLSDDGGYYAFNNLRVGNYEVKADLEGFQPVRVVMF